MTSARSREGSRVRFSDEVIGLGKFRCDLECHVASVGGPEDLGCHIGSVGGTLHAWELTLPLPEQSPSDAILARATALEALASRMERGPQLVRVAMPYDRSATVRRCSWPQNCVRAIRACRPIISHVVLMNDPSSTLLTVPSPPRSSSFRCMMRCAGRLRGGTWWGPDVITYPALSAPARRVSTDECLGIV